MFLPLPLSFARSLSRSRSPRSLLFQLIAHHHNNKKRNKQVEALEVILDARDALKAPLKNATWTLAEAAAAGARAKLRQRNATLTRALAKQLISLENATVISIANMKENALNMTEIKLRTASKAAAASAAASGGSSPAAATLIAKALNLTADAVDRQLQDLLTVQQYREAAWRSMVQAKQLSTAEEQGAFATLGSFTETAAPVTTPPAPISAPVGGAPLSSEDAAAAAAKEASALPRSDSDPETSTIVVRDTSGADSSASSFPLPPTSPTAVFAKVAREKSSAAAAAPRPASMVDEADAEIASWLSDRPLEADSADEKEHLSKVAAWISTAPGEEPSLSSSAAEEAELLDGEVASYAAQAESVLAGVASSDAAPEGGAISPEVAAEASGEERREPAFAPLPSSLSPSAARAFFRKQYPNGTITRSTPGGLAPSEAPSAAVGALTYPATSLDSEASPAIKDYYRYLALRVMGFSKQLAATAVAATGDRSLATAIKYCLVTLKIELADGAQPVWTGQAATPYVIPQTGTVNSFAAQNSQQGGKKRRSLFAEAPAPPEAGSAAAAVADDAATADEAAPAVPASSSSSSSPASSSSAAAAASTNARKLLNFGTNTSPPPPPSPPPPGPSPPPGPTPSPSPSFGTYAIYRVDNTAVSRQKNGYSSDPPDGGLCAGGGYVISMANEVASVRAQSDPATALRTVTLFDLFQGTTGDGFGDPHW